MQSSRVHREAALSRPSRCFKAGASERSPPLWPGINAALTLRGDADRFTREACADKGGGLGRPGWSDAGVVVVLVLNRFRCSTGSLQNYSIIALSFLRKCGKKRYSTARYPSPSSSTAHARPGEATVNPYIGVLAQKDACMTTKISRLKRRSGGSMAYVVTFS